MHIETDTATIAALAELREEENYAFRTYLDRQDHAAIDEKVFVLNKQIAPQIDCTACGQCCKVLMVNITEPEVERLSVHLEMSIEATKTKYVETSLQGEMIMNSIPCHFLKDTACSIYEHRFTECREFPRLHRPGFVNRLFATFMHYAKCPIIYNVVEELKVETKFKVQS